jgi:hypothetical protein
MEKPQDRVKRGILFASKEILSDKRMTELVLDRGHYVEFLYSVIVS